MPTCKSIYSFVDEAIPAENDQTVVGIDVERFSDFFTVSNSLSDC